MFFHWLRVNGSFFSKICKTIEVPELGRSNWLRFFWIWGWSRSKEIPPMIKRVLSGLRLKLWVLSRGRLRLFKMQRPAFIPPTSQDIKASDPKKSLTKSWSDFTHLPFCLIFLILSINIVMYRIRYSLELCLTTVAHFLII